MIIKTHKPHNGSDARSAPIWELAEAVEYGEFARFRCLLQPERERLMARARARLSRAEAEDCVESAVALAFRRFPNRPTDCSLMRWLRRLLRESIQTLSSYQDMMDEYYHS